MKVSFLMLFIFGAINAFAAPATVKITSFYYAGSHTRAAEVCGQVDGMSGQSALVRVIVDEKSKTPGIYHATVEADGRFCLTVVTSYGTASASVPSLNIQSSLEHIMVANPNVP